MTTTTLLTDRNVRTDLQLSKEFEASIKTHGVLQPVIAVEAHDGLRVRMGHRRRYQGRTVRDPGAPSEPTPKVTTPRPRATPKATRPSSVE